MNLPEQLCVDCDWMDAKSKDKWDKAVKRAQEMWLEENLSDPAPEAAQLPYTTEFDSFKPHCTHNWARRQPTIDPVAGFHLNGAPWKTCREMRKGHEQICPWFEERKQT